MFSQCIAYNLSMDLAQTVLNTIRLSLKLSIDCGSSGGDDQGNQLWCIRACSSDGSESWTAMGAGKYEAAYALAEIVGFDLMDG